MFDKYIFNKIDIFNFIRGIAILLVFCLHTVILVEPAFEGVKCQKIFYTPAWLAMWIFFFLSGYLLGKGFYNGKYDCSKGGIAKFYSSRLIRILPMYFLFLFSLFLFYNPTWFVENPKQILKLITFTYNGTPGIVGTGAVWFVSTIVQLYILAPFGYKLFKHFEKQKKVVLFFLIVLGLGYRLLTDLFKLDYYSYVYIFSLANIDLFFGGMLLNSFTKDSENSQLKTFLRPISLILLFAMIVLYIIFQQELSWWLYNYFFPTFTLITMLLIAYSHDYKGKIKSQSLTLFNLIKNPLRIVEYLGIISFTIYLYHSNILELCVNLYKNKSLQFAISNSHLPTFIFITALIITFIFAVFLHYILEIPMNKLRTKG